MKSARILGIMSADQTLAPREQDIGRLARIGALWSLFLIVGKNILNLVSTAILARYLSPEDYGIFGMVATFTTFLVTFADLGLSWSTISSKTLSKQQIDNLFWINSGIGLILWLCCFAAGPALEWFYQQGSLTNLAGLLGLSFFITGLAAQPKALLIRQMRMKQIASIDLIANLLSLVVAIYLAANGYKYWALVFSNLLNLGLSALFSFYASGFRPQFATSQAGTIPLLKFGGYVSGYSLANYFSRNLDNILVGKFSGATELGFYSRAYFLMTLPSVLAQQSLSNVVIPALAQWQDNKEKFGSVYRKATRSAVFLGAPLAAGMFLTTSDLVRIVYGDKWLEIIPLLYWLSFAGIFQPFHNTYGWLYMATNQGRPMFMWGAFSSAVLALSFLIGIKYKAYGVAVSYALTMTFILTLPALYFAHRFTNLSFRKTLKENLPIFICCFLMMATVYLAQLGCETLGLSWQLIFAVKIALGVLSYSGFSVLLIRPLPFEKLERLVR